MSDTGTQLGHGDGVRTTQGNGDMAGTTLVKWMWDWGPLQGEGDMAGTTLVKWGWGGAGYHLGDTGKR